jgi:hypothetical protein
MDTAPAAMNLIDTVTEIVAREVGADSTEPVRVRIRQAISELQDMDTRDALELRWFEYEIEVQSRITIDLEIGILASIRSLDIAAAPELAAVIPFGNSGVIIRRYWACPGERLVPAEPSVRPFDVAARERIRRDMAVLAEHGKIHTYARGFPHWFVSEHSHTIVLNQWISCTEAKVEECRRFVKSINFQLDMRYE